MVTDKERYFRHRLLCDISVINDNSSRSVIFHGLLKAVQDLKQSDICSAYGIDDPDFDYYAICLQIILESEIDYSSYDLITFEEKLGLIIKFIIDDSNELIALRLLKAIIFTQCFEDSQLFKILAHDVCNVSGSNTVIYRRGWQISTDLTHVSKIVDYFDAWVSRLTYLLEAYFDESL
jgi:hypothetical protein